MLTAKLLTILFSAGLIGSVGALLFLAWRHRRENRLAPPSSHLVQQTNRWLRLMAGALTLVAMALAGTHAYWALWASDDETFASVQRRRDARLRRIEESGLRGWVFDRTQQAARSLAGYRMRGEEIVRTYTLSEDALHIVGYFSLFRGSAGAELAYASRLRSSLGARNLFSGKGAAGEDVTLTLDLDLQKTAAEQLRRVGKPGAAVVLSVETGDVLAMTSYPSFDPHRIGDEAVWKQLQGDASQPFVNRALNQYYLPGSTFKILVAAGALERGWSNPRFTCSSHGYRPAEGNRPIFDDRGPSEVHGQIGLAEALRVSCNQYFAQLGVQLAHQELAATARQFGMHIDATAEQGRERRLDEDLWCNREPTFRRVFSPHASRLVLSERTPKLDLAYEAYGQGFVQVTPLYMAMVIAAIAKGGQMMTARLDHFYEPRLLRRTVSTATAERLQALLVGVTEHPSGTAFQAFSQLRAQGVRTGGKTGTAQLAQGQTKRVDSWFVGFAPMDRPRIAYAVVVEGGGYGGQVAAPIAATLVEAAHRIGILQGGPKP